MKSIVVFIVSFCLAEAFSWQGHTDISPRVVNGQAAQFQEFPFMVGVKQDKGGFCGGSLIAHEWVLTAGHCIYRIQSVTVYLGSIVYQDISIHHVVGMRNLIVHNKFDPATLNNDIGLIKIPSTEYTTAITAIPLATNGFIVDDGSFTFTMGWGRNATNGRVSDTLLYTDVRVIDNKQCSSSYRGIDNNKLCTFMHSGGGACYGDSGGPLVHRSSQLLVGILSRVPPNGCLAGPDLYTRITSYLDWIRSKTGIKT